MNGLSKNCGPFAVVIIWICTGRRVTFWRGSLHILVGSDHSEWFVWGYFPMLANCLVQGSWGCLDIWGAANKNKQIPGETAIVKMSKTGDVGTYWLHQTKD